MENSFEFAATGGEIRLFHNLGGGRFEDVTDKMGVGSTRWTLAVAPAGFNGDGWPDLFPANVYRPGEPYLNAHAPPVSLSRGGLESESQTGTPGAPGAVP